MSENAVIREQVERLLNQNGRVLGLDLIVEQLVPAPRETVRAAIKHLVKVGKIIQVGTNRNSAYQSVLPNNSMGSDMKISTAASVQSRAPARAPASVTWPEGVKVQRLPSLASERLHGQWTGVDWSNSVQRPGCQDHLSVPSRRGDQLVPHRPAAGMRTSNGSYYLSRK